MMNGDEAAKMTEEDAREAIIGTWEKIAQGMYIDHVTDFRQGEYIIEYLPNGIGNLYIEGVNMSEPTWNEKASKNGYPGYYLNQMTYTIKGDILIEKNVDWGYENRYKYRFFENGEKLELIDADWTPRSRPNDNLGQTLPLFIHIRILKKTNKQTNN
jgi:hypothetical protein